MVTGTARNASKRKRDARASRSHEVSDRPRLTQFAKNTPKKTQKKWSTLNPGPTPKPRNKCNPIPPHHGEDLSAE